MKSHLNHVCEKIESANIITTPWDHIHIKNIFPNNLYKEIRNEITKYIPDARDNKRVSKRIYNTTQNYNVATGLIDETPEKSPYESWLLYHTKYKTYPHGLEEYYNILDSIEIKNILTKKFNITKKYKNGLKHLFSDCDIMTPGYEWPIHTDISRKLVTFIHYFAEKDEDEEIGTRLYPTTSAKTLDYEKDCVKVIPFVENSALIFSPCDIDGKCTNHAMRNKSTTTKYRKAIQTFFIKQPKE